MKKFALATLLALTAASAFAGFNNTAAGNTPTAITVQQALKSPDNSMVTLKGQIVNQIDDDEFVFSDPTGQIKIEIERQVWNGLNVGADDTVIIYGKLDNEMFEKPELEVLHIEKAR